MKPSTFTFSKTALITSAAVVFTLIGCDKPTVTMPAGSALGAGTANKTKMGALQRTVGAKPTDQPKTGP